MNKILNLNEARILSKKLHQEKQTIVLTGGCFDILHVGHFSLFEHAKKEGDKLVVLLENDEKIKKTKGLKRPLHSQSERAYMLSLIIPIDYVILLPFLESDDKYDDIIEKIKPDIIATTKNDPNIKHKKRQAEKIGAKVKEVIPYIPEKSTSNILAVLFKEN
jgi:rfaE bifunctional protein nucleotidyltransferase chain/domain